MRRGWAVALCLGMTAAPAVWAASNAAEAKPPAPAPTRANGGPGEPVRIRSVRLERPVVELYERCELTLQLSRPAPDPYDPDQALVQVTFQSPQRQTITIEGFYYQPYERVRQGSQDSIEQRGDPVWKARFTPTQVGRWSYEVSLKTPQGTQVWPVGSFEVSASERRGFVRVDPATQTFRFSRANELFVPVGENLAWGPGAQPLPAYEEWFADLAKQRANYIRMWMAPWMLRLETKETGVGRYDQRRAWILDTLLERSEKVGLYWQLSLFDHGSFSQSHDAAWNDNPYNEQCGGMCRLPTEFATDPKARQMCQRLLRYLVNRWGYSPNLAMWDLFNEIDISDFQTADARSWIADTSRFLRSIDPNRRPITVSFHHESPPEVWSLPTIDAIQLHKYESRDFAELFCGTMIEELRQQYHKPVMVGEFGWITEFMRQMDREGLHLHDGLWASLMGGSAAGAMTWYWDVYVHPNHLERHLGAVAKFWRGEDVDRPLQRLDLGLSDAGLIGCGVGNSERAYVWMKNRAHNLDQYLAYRTALVKRRLQRTRGQDLPPPAYPPQDVRDATVNIKGLHWTGRYRVEWWDPYRGEVLSRSVGRVQRGALTLQVPELMFDVAVKLIKLRWWEQG